MNHVPLQDFGLHLVEVPSLLTASLHTRSWLRSDLLCEDNNQHHNCRLQCQQASNHPLHKITITLWLVAWRCYNICDRFFCCADMTTTSINQWKASGGNSTDIIQQETSLAIWRPVPSYSNPADLISWGIEPSTYNLQYGGRDHMSSQELLNLSTRKSTTSKSAVKI